MQNKEKVALFDFCETIANFQTADAFVDYVRQESNNNCMLIKEKFRLFLIKTRLLYIIARFFRRSSINKRLLLWQLRGFDKEQLEIYAASYFSNIIAPNLISIVVERLKEYQNNGWHIYIISGGYEIYLKYFCREYDIPEENLISVKIKYSGSKCLGCFDGGDRLWDKTKKLDEILNKNEIYSVAYSDSITDLPLLTWANEGFVVRRADKQQWSNNLKLKEIIWEK